MNKVYTPAAATNIEQMFRDKYNYVPAREMPEIVAKWDMFKKHGRDITKDDKHEQTT